MTDDIQDDMELGVWGALRSLDKAVEAMLAVSVIDPKRPELIVDYQRARSGLTDPIVKLREALKKALPEQRAIAGESWAECAFAAVLIAYDERELTHPGSAPPEQLLQTQYAKLYDGGEQFFVYLERALRNPATPALVLQVFLFCLRSRFLGRYTKEDDRERAGYVSELAERVGKPPTRLADSATSGRAVKRIKGKLFPYVLYGAAMAVIVAAWFGLNSIADAHQHARAGKGCEEH